MYTKQLTGILLVFLSIFCFTSCNHDDVNFPTFTFNENGECEPASLTPISSARFEEAVVGYGWKHVHTYEINPDGTCQTQDYYQDLTGTGPTQYYVESNSSLKNTCTLTPIQHGDSGLSLIPSRTATDCSATRTQYFRYFP